jgi:transposase
MPERVQVRVVDAVEAAAVRRLAAARTEPAAVVQRARVIRALLDAPPSARLSASAAGRRAGFTRDDAGPRWVRRFNAAGVAGLRDARRPGRPATHPRAVRDALIALAVQKPAGFGEPFALWTLERLQRAFQQRHGVHLSDSTIWTWLKEEGLVWKRQQSWFHEPARHDPAFAEKRGSSSRPTSPRPRTRACSASTSSGRSS